MSRISSLISATAAAVTEPSGALVEKLTSALPSFITPGMLISAGVVFVSLLGVLLMGRVVRWLDLGRPARLSDEAHAIAVANEVEFGFHATDAALGREGKAAIVRNARGEHIVLRAHGNHFITRRVGPDMVARLDRHALIFTPSDPIGTIVLELGDQAPVWAAQMGRSEHAAPVQRVLPTRFRKRLA